MAGLMPDQMLSAQPSDQRDVGMLVRFAIVGATTTALDAGLFLALTTSGTGPVIANTISYTCGIALSYALNRRWTFRQAGGGFARALRFYLLMLAGMLLSTALVAVLSMLLPALAAKLLSIPVVFAYNYTTSRRWVFGSG